MDLDAVNQAVATFQKFASTHFSQALAVRQDEVRKDWITESADRVLYILAACAKDYQAQGRSFTPEDLMDVLAEAAGALEMHFGPK